MFRLTQEPGGFGLSCDAAGLSLAGVPLLREGAAGFAPRRVPEIAALVEAAYGPGDDPTRLKAGLGAIARALNGGELARAAIAAVLTRTPELSPEAATRLAEADQRLGKYNPDELRDWRGRWTTEGVDGQPRPPTPAHRRAGVQVADASGRIGFEHAPDTGERGASPAAPAPDRQAEGDAGAPTALEQAFERQYDDLGPVDFAKRVIQFGDWLGRQGNALAPADKARALAEYAFLEDRLSFWLAYEYTPPTAHDNLRSAAMFLFQGANNAGIVEPGHLPKSMLDVAGDATFTDGMPPRLRAPDARAVDAAPETPAQPPQEAEGLGGIIDNSRAKIDFGAGSKNQGLPFEELLSEEIPGLTKLAPNSKAFDGFVEETGEAVSAKTIYTLTIGYIKNQGRIYSRMKKYIRDVVEYEPRIGFDLDPDLIISKTIQVAIPEYTSPTQWNYIYASIIYGKERGVRIVVTRIRE